MVNLKHQSKLFLLRVGLSPAQSRRMSKKPDTGTPPDKSKFRSSNRLIGNNNQDKPQKKNNNKTDSKPPTPVEVKVSPPPPTSDQQPPAVRIVNGPGSSPTPEQPKNQFLNKTPPEPTLVTVTSLATSESKL